jgi:endo-1,4-beta-xylanase
MAAPEPGEARVAEGLTRRESLTLGAAAMLATGAAPAGSLEALARAKGLAFGTAIPVRALHDPAERRLVLSECGIIVPENELKWYALRPAPDRFDFRAADRLAAFARDNGLIFRGHNLLWNRNEYQPGWLATHDFGPDRRATVEKLLTDHIHTVAGRYAGQIDSWDVVNETIDPVTGAMRDTLFTRALGPQVMDVAFHAAREAAPKAKLVYNDYMGFGPGDARHRAGVLRLLEGMKARGVPVDALGVQGHIGNGDAGNVLTFSAADAREWRQFIDRVTGLGLDLLVTEFDVNDTKAPAEIGKRDALVASLGRDFLQLMLTYPQLKQVLCWGLSDNYSWLQGRWPRADGLAKRPTPYDAQLRAKPLREAIAAAFRLAHPRPPWP